jgi:Mrp family chromosome partitioning ATPase
MEPIDYMGALRRSWRLLIALGILGLVVAVLIPAGPKADKGTTSGPKWSASTMVGSAPGGAQSVLGGGVTNTQVDFYASSSAVRSATLQAYGLDATPANMAYLLSSRPAKAVTKRGVQNSPTILTAQGNSAYGAMTLVTVYEQQLGDYLVNLASNKQKQSKSSSNAPDITTDSIGYTVVTPASPIVNHHAKKSSIASSRKVRGLVGLAIGLAIAALIVLARELLDKRIRSRERAESTFGYPVVAEIPGDARFHGEQARELDVVGEPDSVGAEAYRMLRMSVLFEGLAPKMVESSGVDALLASSVGMGLRNGAGGPGNGKSADSPTAPAGETSLTEKVGRREVVLVVSAGTEPTRAQVAANFAAVYAEAGQRAVVISTAELGTGRLGVPTGAITGEISREDVESRLEPSRIEDVFRLPLSDFVDNSGQLVTRAPAVIEAARSVADVVVVEAPPLLAVHHAEALSHAVDVVLLVGECWETTYDDARRAGEVLRRMEAPVLGVVLTNVRVSRRDVRHAHASLRRMPEPGDGPPSEPNGQPVVDLTVAASGTPSQA